MNGKPSSPVLRGLGASDGARLLDRNRVTSELPVIRPKSAASATNLVLATRMQLKQNHQVRQREQPLIRLHACHFSRACDEPYVPSACQAVEMLQADPGQVGSLRVRKDLLTRLDFNHAIALSYPQNYSWTFVLNTIR